MLLLVIRAVWGAGLLLAPDRMLGLVGDRSPEVERLTRLLGARHVAEAATLVATRGTRPPPRWPVAMDAVHALSMLALAAIAPRHRRAALTSAGIAAGLVAWAELERH